MTTLKEFVTETMQHIAEATNDFNEAQRREDGTGFKMLGPVLHDGTKQDCFKIDFDVAVTMEKSAAASGSGGAKVLSVISAGASAKGSLSQTADNRVKFTVALTVPNRG